MWPVIFSAQKGLCSFRVFVCAVSNKYCSIPKALYVLLLLRLYSVFLCLYIRDNLCCLRTWTNRKPDFVEHIQTSGQSGDPHYFIWLSNSKIVKDVLNQHWYFSIVSHQRKGLNQTPGDINRKKLFVGIITLHSSTFKGQWRHLFLC